MKRTLLALAVILAVIAAVRTPLLGVPLERDEGEYAYIAWRTASHELPYRDWFDQKPPGVFYVYKMALALPIEAVSAIHLLGLLFLAAAACALYFLALRFVRWHWAVIAGVLFALLSADPLVEGTAANTELFMALPVILSLLAALSAATRNQGRMTLSLAAGILAGIAIAFKQIAIFDLPLLVFSYGLFAEKSQRLGRTLVFAAWTCAGVAAVWGLTFAYFAINHGWKDFIYDVLTHNLEYINATSWLVRFKQCLQSFGPVSRSEGIVWLFSAGGVAVLAAARKMREFLFLTIGLAASAAGAGASGYFFPHYFQPLLPLLSLSAVVGAESLETAHFWQAVPAWMRRIIPALALFALPAWGVYPFIFTYSPEESVKKIYPHNAMFAEMPALGRRLAQLTRPPDRVFIFGAEPELLFYARRASATRYIFLFPLYGPYSDVVAKQMQTADEITANRPAAALYLPNALFFGPQGRDQRFTEWSKAYLRENFHDDTYLASDSRDEVHLIPASDLSSPAYAQMKIFGSLMAKKPK